MSTETYRFLYFTPTAIPIIYEVSPEIFEVVKSGKLPVAVTPDPPKTDPPVVVTPPTAEFLTFLPPTWDGKAISFHSKGGDGTDVFYKANGITDWTKGPIAQPKPFPADAKKEKYTFYMKQSGKEYGPFGPVDMYAVTGGALQPDTPVVTDPPVVTKPNTKPDEPIVVPDKPVDKPPLITDTNDQSGEELVAIYEVNTLQA